MRTLPIKLCITELTCYIFQAHKILAIGTIFKKNIFTKFFQGGYVPDVILDPDKGLEHAVYAKSKGVDYSYATDEATNPYLNKLGADGKPKVSFQLFVYFFHQHILIFQHTKKGKEDLVEASTAIEDQWKKITDEHGVPKDKEPEKPKPPKQINLLGGLLGYDDDTASVATTATDKKSVIGLRKKIFF